MLRAMPAKRFEGWRAYYELEPSLDERIDWLVASIVQMLYNVAAGKGQQKPLKDFVLKFNDEKKVTDWKHQKALMLSLAAVHNSFVDAEQQKEAS